jgi:hypothetical protein
MNNLAPVWCKPFVVDNLVGEIQDVRITCARARALLRLVRFTHTRAHACARHCACSRTNARMPPARRLLDYDSMKSDGTIKGDALGSVETQLSEIVNKGHHGAELPLSGPGAKAGAVVHIMWEESSPAVRGTVTLTLKGTGLANRAGMLGTSDPFWVISKRRPDGVWITVSKSEVVMNDLNPTWKPVVVDLRQLCNGDMKRELKLEVMHKEKDDKFIEIGHQDVHVTAEQLLKPQTAFVLKHPQAKDKGVGSVTVVNALVRISSAASGMHLHRRAADAKRGVPQTKLENTFQNYVDGALDVSLIAAIDRALRATCSPAGARFCTLTRGCLRATHAVTASNGEPSSPSSLHYASAGMTPYQVAINAVSKVLAPCVERGCCCPRVACTGMRTN